MMLNFLIILITLIILFVSFLIGAFFLMLSTKIFGTENKNYKTALKVLWIPTLISLILTFGLFFLNLSKSILLEVIISILIFVLSIWLVMKNYSEGVGKSILIILVAGVMQGIILLIFVFILWSIISSVLMGSIHPSLISFLI